MNTRIIGYGLMAVGLVMLLFNFYEVKVDLTLLIIGGAFLLAYFGNFTRQKNIGFLIPGTILCSLGAWEIVSAVLLLEDYSDVGFLGAIGTAFLAIYIIGRANGHKVYWSLIVTLSIYLLTAFIFLINHSEWLYGKEEIIFPSILVFIGFFIVMSTLVTKLRKR